MIPGIDGQKMSKSYGNTIPIFAEEKIIKKAVMSILTDSAGINEPKDKDTPLFQIYSMFLDTEGKKLLNDRYDTPGLRYGDLKKELFKLINSEIGDYREKYLSLIENPAEVEEILADGESKALNIATENLKGIRELVGIRAL